MKGIGPQSEESSVRSEEKYKTEYVDAGVELDGPLFELMGNKLRWSAGLQVAKEDVSSSEENFNLQSVSRSTRMMSWEDLRFR